MRIVFGGFIVFFACVALVTAGRDPWESRLPILLALGILVGCLFLFHALTVTVSTDAIQLRFGIGLIRKRFAVAQVQDAAVVRNRWYYGWGIRLGPRGWIFNVSGFDAVEIRMKNNRQYRIGTDDPEALLAAIQSAITKSM
ncbi:MAG: hypothetical protein K9N55_14360 [Phycisphaerae bacterium]|nr:hypothetical protein [Phycisphaerae bacterium]